MSRRGTTRCVTFLRHTSLQKGCPQSLRTSGEAGWDLQQLPELGGEIPRPSVPTRQATSSDVTVSAAKRQLTAVSTPPKRTAFFRSSASVVVEYKFLHCTITVDEVNETC